MRERTTVLFAAFVFSIMAPFVITMLMNGNRESTAMAKEDYESGKMVTVASIDGNTPMDAESFVIQILAAQISPDSPAEALKVQAVIARTMLMKAMEGTSVMDSGSLGLEYMSSDDCMRQWGKRHYEKYMEALTDAVRQTAGQTLQYNGELIDAMYHSVSMGETISAAEAYGQDIPYLVQCSCSKDVEAADYTTISLMTWEQMKEIINTLYTQGTLGEIDISQLEAMPMADRVKIQTATEHGYVQSVMVGNIEVPGDTFAAAAALNSHVYYIETVGDQYRIVTLGKGHGIGLSQYTAKAMALEGKSYQEILSYFYPAAGLS